MGIIGGGGVGGVRGVGGGLASKNKKVNNLNVNCNNVNEVDLGVDLAQVD